MSLPRRELTSSDCSGKDEEAKAPKQSFTHLPPELVNADKTRSKMPIGHLPNRRGRQPTTPACEYDAVRQAKFLSFLEWAGSKFDAEDLIAETPLVTVDLPLYRQHSSMERFLKHLVDYRLYFFLRE